MATSPNPISSGSGFLPGDFPKRQMSYEAELIWVVATDDLENLTWGQSLLGKRKSAGDIDRCGATTGLTPRWPDLPCKSANIRLYVIAHGVEIRGTVPPTIELATAKDLTHNTLTAEDFFPKLKDLVLKTPAKQVKRIALVMCNGGGLKGANAAESISPSESFAQRLVNKCEGLTEDITARMGVVTGERIFFPKETIDGRYKKAFEEGKTNSDKNPLQTIIDKRELSLTNLAKWVDGTDHFRTYIFTPNKPPKLKTGYTE